MTDHTLTARGLTRHFGAAGTLVRAVDEVDLDVRRGEAVAITGPSGCGKSTVLQLLGCLDVPTAGEVRLDGRRTDRLSERAKARVRQERIGFVFQAFHLMAELTVLENIELPALLAGRTTTASRRATASRGKLATTTRTRARDLLDRVGLADRANFAPGSLSGGQQQRVALARALINAPDVLLADEPTGSLDSEATLDILRMLSTLHRDGQTMVIVTHDPRVAAIADRVVSMRDGAFIDDVALGPHRSQPA